MTNTQSSFLQLVVPAAIYSRKTYGVPASITIAQAILESGWGQSWLAQKFNNFFGVKAAAIALPDQYVELTTAEFVAGHKVREQAKFARYPSPVMSFAAHARLLALAERYKPAMNAAAHPELFAEELYHCGYSTNPSYAKDLMELVREFDLTQYDTDPQPTAEAKEKAA